MEKLEDLYDAMNINSDKDILKSLDPDEKIFLSTLVSKFNYKGKKQERIFILTNKYVYNVASPSLFNDIFSKVTSFGRIRRKIPIEKISAISMSKLSSEFVIHVPSEYDYRYSSFDKFGLNIIFLIYIDGI